MTPRTRLAAVLATGLLLLPAAAARAAGASAGEEPSPPVSTAALLRCTQAPVPLLAYFYLWFDPTSWTRDKLDYPRLGRYSSDDVDVMRQQIQWAKAAGIDGFLVSWRDTETNNRRLRLLMTAAASLDFKLAMIYQGLDYFRHRRPTARVAADFDLFRDQFAPNRVFLRLGGKPLTVFSGTWQYSVDDVGAVTRPVRGDLVVLSSEKSVQGYERLARVTDGDAYYWSSVDAEQNTYYVEKLHEMAAAIHADGKYWVAPFAPGFDARLIGGSRAIDRRDGQTLRQQYAAAVSSSPDVLGLISWNEFTENTYIEPSVKFGAHYLDVLRDLTDTSAPQPLQVADSSEPSDGAPAPGRLLSTVNLVLGSLAVLLAGGLLVIGRRVRRSIQRRNV